MPNNKTNLATSHSKIKVSTDPNLYNNSLEELAFGPPSPCNTPDSGYEAIRNPVKFYISSSPSSSSSSLDSESKNDISCTAQRRYTV